MNTNEFRLTTSHYKILLTVSLLNDLGYYPLPSGIRKILIGKVDDETKEFVEFPTFNTLISFPSKKISRYVMMLHRYHYVDKIYDSKTDELYIKITDLGLSSLLKYQKKHKRSFTKKKVTSNPTIVKITK